MNTDTPKETKKLPELKVDSATGKNNYSLWSGKAQALLEAWGYWKYVGGEESTPPIIPARVEPKEVHGIGADGNPAAVIVPGNIAQYEAAIAAAEPWNKMNKKA